MTDQGPWDECPAGTVARMAHELRGKRFRARLRPVIAGAAVLLLVGVVWAVSARQGAAGPLNCAETIPLLADYRSEKLSPALKARVAEHLARCPACRRHFSDQFPGEASIPGGRGKLVAGRLDFVSLAKR